jgi:hypothetical protein
MPNRQTNQPTSECGALDGVKLKENIPPLGLGAEEGLLHENEQFWRQSLIIARVVFGWMFL